MKLKHIFVAVFRVNFPDEPTIVVLDNRVQTVRRSSGQEFLPECLKKNNQLSGQDYCLDAIS